MRYQQIFASPSTTRILSGHSYRRDALNGRGVIDGFRARIQVRLGVSLTAPDAPSTTFEDNLGIGATTVLDLGWIDVAGTDLPLGPPGDFEFVIPYTSPYAWLGADALCMDIEIVENELSSGPNRNFSPSIDAHELFAGVRNIQPGYDFGVGCAAAGSTARASAEFEVRHMGTHHDLFIDSQNGVPSLPGLPTQSILLLSWTQTEFVWPPQSSCFAYGDPVIAHYLGDSSVTGDWSGSVNVGQPAPYFEAIGQIATLNAATGELVLSQGSRLIAPGPSVGITSSRIVHGSNHLSATGTVSFVVPVTRFF
jgi:hypothetical protein